jgi:hypothetical protein
MIEMPSHTNPSEDEVIRALELAHSYFAITGAAQASHALASYTSREAIAHACNPIVGTPAAQLRGLVRGALNELRARPGADASVYAGARALRGTLRAYLGMKPERRRIPKSERKERPTYRVYGEGVLGRKGFPSRAKAEAYARHATDPRWARGKRAVIAAVYRLRDETVGQAYLGKVKRA